MKLATFLPNDAPGPVAGAIDDGRARAFASGLRVIDILGGASAKLGEEAWPLEEVRLLAPIPEPGTIYAIGHNYEKHIAEIGAERPEAPIVFVKVSGSAASPGGPIVCPQVVRRLDYEGELTVVIGEGGAIGGYCIADDVTARDLQGRELQWTRAKGADTFCPFGPWITTVEEVPDPHNLDLKTWVNGELRQDSNTGDLLFGCQELVGFISQTCTLRPGDLILTGTPSGVGQGLNPPRFLEPGDTIRIEIEGLGAIEHGVT